MKLGELAEVHSTDWEEAIVAACFLAKTPIETCAFSAETGFRLQKIAEKLEELPDKWATEIAREVLSRE